MAGQLEPATLPDGYVIADSDPPCREAIEVAVVSDVNIAADPHQALIHDLATAPKKEVAARAAQERLYENAAKIRDEALLKKIHQHRRGRELRRNLEVPPAEAFHQVRDDSVTEHKGSS